MLIPSVHQRDSGSQRTGLWSRGRESGGEGSGVARCKRSPLGGIRNAIEHQESFRDCGSGGVKDSWRGARTGPGRGGGRRGCNSTRPAVGSPVTLHSLSTQAWPGLRSPEEPSPLQAVSPRAGLC